MRTVMEHVGMEQLGVDLRKIRLTRNLTQAKVAEMTGIKQSHLSMLERGKRTPTLDNLLVLCVALNAELRIVAH